MTTFDKMRLVVVFFGGGYLALWLWVNYQLLQRFRDQRGEEAREAEREAPEPTEPTPRAADDRYQLHLRVLNDLEASEAIVERGWKLWQIGAVSEDGEHGYRVSSGEKSYRVRVLPAPVECDCSWWANRAPIACKHLAAVVAYAREKMKG